MIENEEGRFFRVVKNDNLFKVIDGKGFYLEDYNEGERWHSDPTIIERLRNGEYKVEEYEQI